MKSLSVKTTVSMILILWSYIVRAQTSGEIESKYTTLEAKNSSNIEFLPSTDGKSRYEIDEENKENIKVSFSGSKMLVNFDKPGGKLKIYAPQFEKVELKDISKLNIDEGVKFSRFEIETRDASRLNGSINADVFLMTASDASRVTLSGKATEGTMTIKDASVVDMLGIDVINLTVEAKDASKSCFYSTGKFVVKSRDMAKVCYKVGKDGNVDINVKGMSSVMPAENDKMAFGGDEDTVRIKFGGKRIMIIKDEDHITKVDSKKKKPERDMKNVWAGFELGMNSFVTPELSFNQDPLYSYLDCNIGKSWFYGLNFLEKDLHLVKNKVALTTGLGVEWSNFRLKGNTYLAPGVDVLFPITDSVPLSNNRMRSFNINVPVLLKIAPQSATKNNGGFHIAAGLILSYTPLVSQRLETKSSGYEQETWTRDDFNVNPFRATATVRVGYGWLRMFANYSITPYFNQKAGPDIRHFAAGITLIPFG